MGERRAGRRKLCGERKRREKEGKRCLRLDIELLLAQDMSHEISVPGSKPTNAILFPAIQLERPMDPLDNALAP